MEIARDVLLFIHLLGFASLFGGAFVQIRDEVVVVNSAMLNGAITQVVSGILAVGVVEGLDEPVDHTKIAVKFAIGLLIAVLCWVNRRKESVPRGLFFGLVVLTVANVAVAVFW